MDTHFRTTILNNMNDNGGGLAINITGKFESNRHAIARMEKVTFGQVAKHLSLKRNGGLKISATELLNIYRCLFGEPEWHHAGKIPKSFGGGMKKTYFLDFIPNVEDVKKWIDDYNKKMDEIQELENQKQKKKLERDKFLKKNAIPFSRVSEENIPKFSIITVEEMNGKYGWFEASYRYNLPIYYTGFAFKSNKSKENFLKNY